MNKILLVALPLTLLLTGCMVATGRDGELEVIPVLPSVVEIGPDAYYAYGGYHYFYDHDRWYYAPSREGPRRELPRSHWPRETRRRY